MAIVVVVVKAVVSDVAGRVLLGAEARVVGVFKLPVASMSPEPAMSP